MKKGITQELKGFVLGVVVTGILMTSGWALAKEYKVGDVIGQALYTDIVTYIDDQYVPSCNVYGYTVIPMDSLADLGYDLQWYGEERVLAAYSPQYLEKAGWYFDIGSTKEEVRAVMGAPNKITKYNLSEIWYYNKGSEVTFNNEGIVIAYDQGPGNTKPLKIRP